jgi:uncharacterized protein
MLRAIGATVLAPALAGAHALARPTTTERSGRRRTVGIVGGGIGGVAAAWLLDGDWDVVLFEADPDLGGHAHTLTVDYRGRPIAVDVGAQNFAPGTHPTYVKLLELLGLFDPLDSAASPTVNVPLSLSVYRTRDAPTPLFVSPYAPERTWPLGEAWNVPAIVAFATLIDASRRLESDDVDWSLTVEDWVESIALSREDKDGLAYPFIASLNNQDVEAGKALSARAGMYFVTRALTDDPLAGVNYYNSLIGLGGIVQRLADDCTTLTVHTGAPVEYLTRVGGRWRIASRDRRALVDRLIVATPPYIARRLLRGLAGGGRLARVLDRFPYYSTQITIHTDPAYVPADRRFWSFDNVEVANGWGQGSLWYGAVHPPFADGGTVDIFKSWTTNRSTAPQSAVYTQDFRHALTTPEATRAQEALDPLQGRRGLWFAGSHCLEVDSQDTALRSAMRIADALAPRSAHYLALKAKLNVPGSFEFGRPTAGRP